MIKKLLFLVGIVLIVKADVFKLEGDNTLVTKNLVKEINSLNLGWTAGYDQGSFINGITVSKFKTYLGARQGGPVLRTKQDHEFTVDVTDLPDEFDSRTNWPQCKTIGWIRDQSACGSCWAFGASEAISDRYCTYKVNDNLNISAADIAFCCGFECGDGCNGGYPSAAWQYWVDYGVVSSDCYPYPFPSCDHHIPDSAHPCPSNEYPTPSCPNRCTAGSNPWSSSKHYGADAWNVHGEAAIMKEIYENGPVETAFSVYSDFPSYRSGIYVRHSNQFLGGHAVKFLGWGVEGGVKYWIVANSWNPDWGDKGTFKILRGANECGIENTANAGKPKN